MNPRKKYYLLTENRPEMMQTLVHRTCDAETELEAHREAKEFIEQNHNKYIKLLECRTVGEYRYNSILLPDNVEEGMLMEPNDPQ